MSYALYVKAVLLGLVEGLTEYLPISSTGHLIVAGDWLQFNRAGAKSFEVFIQLGAILAVCWFYRHRLVHTLRDLGRTPLANQFVLNLSVAFLPAAVVGFLAHDFIKAALFKPLVVAWALIVGGVAILIIEHRARPNSDSNIDTLRMTQALGVGIAQIAALIPGVSRSGATIMGGLLAGLRRETATEFSFFLAIPVMFAATLYDLSKEWQHLSTEDLGLFGAGFVTAFISALLTIRFLLHFVARHSFAPFAYYRIAFGLFLLWWYSR